MSIFVSLRTYSESSIKIEKEKKKKNCKTLKSNGNPCRFDLFNSNQNKGSQGLGNRDVLSGEGLGLGFRGWMMSR